jgi:hypothetical protein
MSFAGALADFIRENESAFRKVGFESFLAVVFFQDIVIPL